MTKTEGWGGTESEKGKGGERIFLTLTFPQFVFVFLHSIILTFYIISVSHSPTISFLFPFLFLSPCSYRCCLCCSRDKVQDHFSTSQNHLDLFTHSEWVGVKLDVDGAENFCLTERTTKWTTSQPSEGFPLVQEQMFKPYPHHSPTPHFSSVQDQGDKSFFIAAPSVWNFLLKF